MNNTLLYLATGLIVFVSFFHSYAGQKRLIGPLLQESNKIVDNPTWRAIILFGWHSTTILMLVIGLYLALVASGVAASNMVMILGIGIAFIALGIGNAVLAKFKHPGWIMLSGIGILTILSLYI